MSARLLPLSPRVAISVAGLALLGGGWSLSGTRQAAAPRFERAWWYWHHPFRLSGADVSALRRAGCARLYVHAGTLVARGDELELTSPQRFESAAPCELYAVLRIHPGAHALLLSPEGPLQIARLLRTAKLPGNVRGLQLDADIPTRRLAEYARLLEGLHRELPTGWSLSVTALPYWLGTRGYARVCDAVEEVAPQFYGNRWPTAGRKPPPLWEVEGLQRRIKQATAGRARAWIGLPAYGRCVVLDPQGRPVGVRHDLNPEELLDSADWTPVAGSTGPDSEDCLPLRATAEAEAGVLKAAPGSTLWFQWPRVDALERTERELAAEASPNLAGVCYFRWPAPGEPLALRPQPRAQQPTAAGLALEFQRTPEGSRLVVRNDGADAPLLSPGAQVTLTGELSEVAADGPVEFRRGDEPCSPLRADRACFARPLLRPGSQWTVCRLPRAAVACSARLTWSDGPGTPHALTATLPPEERTR